MKEKRPGWPERGQVEAVKTRFPFPIGVENVAVIETPHHRRQPLRFLRLTRHQRQERPFPRLDGSEGSAGVLGAALGSATSRYSVLAVLGSR